MPSASRSLPRALHAVALGTCAALCAGAVAAAPALGAEGDPEEAVPTAVPVEEPAPPAAEDLTAPDPGGEPDPRAYLFADGVAVVEAETASPTPGQTRSWLASARAGSVGGAMRAGPDGGPAIPAGNAPAAAPRLSVPVRFDAPGVYHVWVRGWAPNPAGDSLHVGLDGDIQSLSMHLLGRTRGSWAWFRTRISYPTARLVVGTAGVHSVDVWMREDGFEIDRLMLTTEAFGAPEGGGPPESPREG